MSGEIYVMLLLITATPEQYRAAIQKYIVRESAEANRPILTPLRTSHWEAIKIEPYTYSGDGPDRPHLSLII